MIYNEDEIAKKAPGVGRQEYNSVSQSKTIKKKETRGKAVTQRYRNLSLYTK